MPPPLAFFLTVIFIVFLFRRDLRERPNVTGALWLPVTWMLLVGSRSLVQWLSLTGYVTLSPTEEGNPIDAVVYFTLIAAGFYVLNQRQVRLSTVFRNNGWLMAFLLYCFIAIVWSDFPLIAFKRWIKILGHPIMALIVLTEPDPEEAITRLIKRCAYVLLPVSILFIKYFPEWGRTFDVWTGLATNTGITQGKNALGCECLILGFFLSWHLLRTWRTERGKARRNELLLTFGLLIMIAWLLLKAHSATSFLSLSIGLMIAALLGLRFVNKRLIGTYVILGVATLVIAEFSFGFVEYLVELTQHDTTLAGRVELWRALLAMDTSPVFGVGFESFWLGQRIEAIQASYWWHPTQAHNGYLEIYLDLGLAGLMMVAGLLFATFNKARRGLLTNFEWARVRMGFLAAVILFNWTEATFKGLNVLWFVFYIIALDYPKLYAAQHQVLEGAEHEEDKGMAGVSSGQRAW